jgi:PAS domain S-box-containing protein
VALVTIPGLFVFCPAGQARDLLVAYANNAITPFGLPEVLSHPIVRIIVLGILLLGLLAYQGYRWRLRYLKARQSKLEHLIAERTEQLRLSDAKNRAILQALPDAIFRIDSEGTYLEFFSSSGFRTIVPSKEFLGKKFSEVLPPELAQLKQDYITRAQQTRQTQSFQYETRDNGSPEYFETCIVALDEGESLAIVRDITARKQTEKTLRDLESFRLIAEASPIAMAITRLSDGVIIYANHHVEQILGIPIREIIGRKAPDFYCDLADRAKVLDALRQNTRLHQYELKVKKPDGTPFWILFSCQQFIFDGELALLTGYYDITARKQAEELLHSTVRAQMALVQANKALLSTLDLDSLLIRILQTAQQAIPAAEKGSILLWNEKHQALQMMSTWGYQDPRVSQITFPAQRGYCNLAARLRKPLIVADARADDAIRYEGEIEEIAGVQSALVVPLILRDELLGVISLDATRTRAFDTNDLELLVAFASQAALAINNARLHQRMRVSEERYRVLYEDNPAMYFTIDAHGLVLSVNRYGAEQLGYAVEELIGKSVLEIFYETDRDQALRQLQVCLQTSPQPGYWELRKVRKDGSLLWVGESARAVRNPSGDWMVLVVCEDITARKQAEKEIRRFNEELEQRVIVRTQALQESETKFRTLAEMATAGIFIYRGEQMRYVNPAAMRISGYSQAELLRMNFWDIIHPDLQALVRERGVARQRGEPVPQRYEVKIMTKGGEERWIDFTASPIEYEGQPAVLGTALDITERKRLAEQLQKYAEELEELVEQRTARIKELERQRTEQEKLAATGRMAARIAHEINNPLGGIRTSFRLLSRAVPREHRHFGYVELIEKEIDRIAQIVRQMLDLHRPQHESPHSFRPGQTIAEVITLLKPRAAERHIGFEQDLQRAQTLVTLPENMLRQILHNVMLNAIEASHEGGRVRLQAAATAEHLLVTVVDYGHGIPEEIKLRILEPFFTTKSKSASGGMGLGLSICKSLVEVLHGTIEFESKVEEGTTCKIAIPLARDF